MDSTGLIAWVGAVTGIGALSLNLWRHFRDGPRVKVSVARDQNRYDGLPGRYIGEYCVVTVSNIGSATTTITRYVIRATDSMKDYLMGRGDVAMLQGSDDDDDPPYELAPGRVWQWTMSEGTAEAICSSSRYVTACVYISSRKRCIRARIHHLIPTDS